MSGFDEADSTKGADLNPAFTEEQKARFRDDKMHFLEYRKGIESEFNQCVLLPSSSVFANDRCVSFFDALHQKSPIQAMLREVFANNMRKSLAKKPELAGQLIPAWDVGCRRLTPGVGYLEALCEDNVEVIRTEYVLFF